MVAMCYSAWQRATNNIWYVAGVMLSTKTELCVGLKPYSAIPTLVCSQCYKVEPIWNSNCIPKYQPEWICKQQKLVTSPAQNVMFPTILFLVTSCYQPELMGGGAFHPGDPIWCHEPNVTRKTEGMKQNVLSFWSSNHVGMNQQRILPKISRILFMGLLECPR